LPDLFQLTQNIEYVNTDRRIPDPVSPLATNPFFVPGAFHTTGNKGATNFIRLNVSIHEPPKHSIWCSKVSSPHMTA